MPQNNWVRIRRLENRGRKVTGRGENSASDTGIHIYAQPNKCRSCPQTHPYSCPTESDLCVQENPAQASKQGLLVCKGLKIIPSTP